MPIQYIAVALLITLALITDIREYKIRNRLTGSFMLAGLCLNFYLGSLHGLVDSLMGIVILLPLLALYAFRFLGAGDVKLLFAVGAVVGFRLSIYCTLLSFVAGGVIAVLYLARRKNGAERAAYLLAYLKAVLFSRKIIPYTSFDKDDSGFFRFGYAIYAGCFLALALNIT